MAKLTKKTDPARDQVFRDQLKGGDVRFVRTGGFAGDTTMQRMERWNAEGAGVDETVRDVGADPNADVRPGWARGEVVE